VAFDRTNTWLVIAAFGEGKVIATVIGEALDDGWQVVVVDDGSRDNTFAAAQACAAQHLRHNGGHAVVLRHVINRGQGAALQTGIDFAVNRGAHAVVTFDADGQHRLADVPTLLAALAQHDVVLGSRFLSADGVVGATESRRALLRTATKVSNRLSGLTLTDAHCGLRAIRTTALSKLRISQDRMAHASELLRKMATSHVRMTEVPITVVYTEYSMRKGQSGFGAIRIMFDYFFRP
jgi:polyprenyl-phospho-N-acetylgalactosaminyl synthase